MLIRVPAGSVRSARLRRARIIAIDLARQAFARDRFERGPRGVRVTYPDGSTEIVGTGEAYHLRPGHFVQTIETVELLEFSPVVEHDRTMATLARNMGLVAS